MIVQDFINQESSVPNSTMYLPGGGVIESVVIDGNAVFLSPQVVIHPAGPEDKIAQLEAQVAALQAQLVGNHVITPDAGIVNAEGQN